MAIDTSKLTGYAKAYAEAINSGASDTAAHAKATTKHGTGGSGSGTAFATFEGSSDGNPLGYEVKDGRTYLTGIVPHVPQYGGKTQITTQQNSLLPVNNIEEMYKSMAQPITPVAEKPTYQQPYDYSSIIPKLQEGLAITSNPSDTYFVPTARYNDRVMQAKQYANDDAYRRYQTELNQWNTQEQQRQQNLLNLLPYTTLTAAQQATQDQQKATAELERQLSTDKAAEDARRWQAEYDLDKRQVDYTTGKPYYSPNTGGGGGDTGNTDDTKTYQWAQTQALNMAKADPRLAAEGEAADGVNTFTLNQLIDAYMRQLAYNMYGG